MSEPLRDWTPEEQTQHRQDLLDALDDIAWDPDWPQLAECVVPDAAPPASETGPGMTRVNIYLPSGLYQAARARGVNISEATRVTLYALGLDAS